MSEVIVRMEMPTVCDECPMMYDGIFCAATGTSVYPNHQARILKNGREFDPCENRLDDCPIVGVLPDEHGDLIDRDVVKKEIMKRMPSWCGTSGTDGYQFCSRREMLYPISHAKVIIAAERKDDEQIH